MNKGPFDDLKKLKDIREIFDLIIFGTYNCGYFKQNIPVDETRELLDYILKLHKKELNND